MQLVDIAHHFKSQSNHSALNAADGQRGVPLEAILAANWSLPEIGKRFYLRSPDKGEFTRAILFVLPD